jgi:hypothetical protein
MLPLQKLQVSNYVGQLALLCRFDIMIMHQHVQYS